MAASSGTVARVWASGTTVSVIDTVAGATPLSLGSKTLVPCDNDQHPTGRVSSVVFSPNSRYVAAVTKERGPVLWDLLAGGEPTVTGLGNADYNGRVVAAGFTPCGQHLLLTTDSQQSVSWDLSALAESEPVDMVDLPGKTLHPGAASYAECGRLIAATTAAVLWDTTAAQPALLKKVDLRNAALLVVSPDGRFVATGYSNGETQVMSVADGKPKPALEGPRRQPVRALAFSRDSKRLAVSYAGETLVWALGNRDARLLKKLTVKGCSALAFSPCGAFLAVASADDHLVSLCAIATDEVLKLGLGATDDEELGGGAVSLAFNRKGTVIVAGTALGSVVAMTVAFGEERKRMTGASAFKADGCITEDGEFCVLVDDGAAVDTPPDGVELLKMADEDGVTPHAAGITAAALCPADGETLATGTNDGKIGVWTFAEDHEEVVEEEEEAMVEAAGEATPFSEAEVSGGGGDGARCCECCDPCECGDDCQCEGGGGSDPEAEKEEEEEEGKDEEEKEEEEEEEESIPVAALQKLEAHRAAVTALAFSTDGETLVSGSDDGKAIVWSLEAGAKLELIGHKGGVSFVGLSPDSRLVLSACDDVAVPVSEKTVFVWDIASGKKAALEGHSPAVSACAFSADGKHIATGSWSDAAVAVWDVRRGTSLGALDGHTGAVTGAAFSPCGALLATSAEDGRLASWVLRDGTCKCPPQDSADTVTAVAVSPNGHFLVYGYSSGRASALDVSVPEKPKVISSGTAHATAVSAVAVIHNGMAMLSCDFSGAVCFWQFGLPGGKPVRYGLQSPTPGLPVAVAAFSPASGAFATASGAEVTLWGPTRTVTAVGKIHSLTAVSSLDVAVNGQHAVAVGSGAVVAVVAAVAGHSTARVLEGLDAVTFIRDAATRN